MFKCWYVHIIVHIDIDLAHLLRETCVCNLFAFYIRDDYRRNRQIFSTFGETLDFVFRDITDIRSIDLRDP